MWRNRIRFFLKVLIQEKRDEFAETLLTEMFRMIYSVHLKGEDNIVKSLMYAFDDAIHGVSGKAKEGKILPRPEVPNRVALALQGAKNVVIKFNGDMEGLGNIIRNIRGFAPNMEIYIAVCDEQVQVQYPKCQIVMEYQPSKYQKHLIMCDHIFKITNNMQQDHYIDAWCNVVFSEEDFAYAKSFEQTKKMFLLCEKELMSI